MSTWMLPDEGGTSLLRLKVWCKPFPNYQRETKENGKRQGEGERERRRRNE